MAEIDSFVFFGRFNQCYGCKLQVVLHFQGKINYQNWILDNNYIYKVNL